MYSMMLHHVKKQNLIQRLFSSVVMKVLHGSNTIHIRVLHGRSKYCTEVRLESLFLCSLSLCVTVTGCTSCCGTLWIKTVWRGSGS